MKFLYLLFPFLAVIGFVFLQILGQKIGKFYKSINFNTPRWTKVICACLSVFFYFIGLEYFCILFGSIVVFD